MSSKVQKLTDNPDSAADIAVAALMDQVGQRVYAARKGKRYQGVSYQNAPEYRLAILCGSKGVKVIFLSACCSV